jgi:proteic killer suppression protein
MIKSFSHSGLENFFRSGSKAGIQPSHAAKLRLQLSVLNTAVNPEDLGVPGWKLHPLSGNMQGHWSIKVNANWRITFKFGGSDAFVVDYQDYH